LVNLGGLFLGNQNRLDTLSETAGSVLDPVFINLTLGHYQNKSVTFVLKAMEHI
jgi:hypothetical protein